MAHISNVFRAFMHIEMTAKMQYRANIALWMVGALVEPIVYLVVWVNVANAQGGTVQGYTAADFAAYYLILLFVRHATAAPGPNLQAWRIRTGNMSFLLLRPIHPIWGDFAEGVSHKVISFIFLIPIALGIGWAFGASLNPPLWSLLAFFPALFLAAALRFFLQYAITMLGFWTERIEGLWSTYWTLQTFMGGMLAPLTFLPGALRDIANVLPFRWFFMFPIELMLGRLSVEDAIWGFVAQTSWTLVSILLTYLLWRSGVKRYGAVGG